METRFAIVLILLTQHQHKHEVHSLFNYCLYLRTAPILFFYSIALVPRYIYNCLIVQVGRLSISVRSAHNSLHRESLSNTVAIITTVQCHRNMLQLVRINN